jgi:hypothetical protein
MRSPRSRVQPFAAKVQRESAMPGALSHGRVLDLSRVPAEPLAGQFLGDLGGRRSLGAKTEHR